MVPRGAADDECSRRRIVAKRVQLLTLQVGKVFLFARLLARALSLEPFAAGDRIDDQVHQESALVAALDAELAAEVTKLAEVTAADLQTTALEPLVAPLCVPQVAELSALDAAARLSTELLPTAELAATELAATERSAEALEVLGSEHLAKDGELFVARRPGSGTESAG